MDFILNYFLPFVVVLSVVVFIHELGHFIVARRNGVKVDAFSIGFGPELFGINDKQGTRWKLSLIPLGGYVKMYGDANAASQPGADNTMPPEELALTLAGKTPWQRIKVAAAGPLANFVLAIVLYAGIFVVKGIPHLPPIVDEMLVDGLAFKSGFKVKDEILSVNGDKPKDFFELGALIVKAAGSDVVFMVKRNQKDIKIAVKMYEEGVDKKPIKRLGIKPSEPVYQNASFLGAVLHAVELTYEAIINSFNGFAKMVTGQVKGGEIGGVLAIGDMVSQSTKHGLATALQFMAFLSIQLGALNLLPVPVLDGGHIVLNAVEMVRRKPLSKKIEEGVYTVGFVLIMSLMVYATWNDLMRYKVFQSIAKLFGAS